MWDESNERSFHAAQYLAFVPMSLFYASIWATRCYLCCIVRFWQPQILKKAATLCLLKRLVDWTSWLNFLIVSYCNYCRMSPQISSVISMILWIFFFLHWCNFPYYVQSDLLSNLPLTVIPLTHWLPVTCDNLWLLTMRFSIMHIIKS